MSLKRFYIENYKNQISRDEEVALKFGENELKKTIGNVENKKILDVGCGTGADVKFLVEDNELYGLDILPEAIQKAKFNGISAILYDIEKPFPFKDNSFDITVCREVIEHLLQPEKTLMEINRVLKKGGFAIVTVPNHYYYIRRIRILFGQSLKESSGYFKELEEWCFPHIRFLKWNGLIRLLSKCKFSVDKDFSYIRAIPPRFFIAKKIWYKLVSKHHDLLCSGFIVKIKK